MGLFRLDFIDLTTEIEAPAALVFDFFKKVEDWPSWARGIKATRRVSKGDWGVGFRFSFSPAFLPFPLGTKVIEYEEGRRIAWGLRTPVASLVHSFSFEPAAEGRCRVRQLEFAEGLLAILCRPLRGKIEAFDRGLARDFQAAVLRAAGRP